jgi:hypothetical protein
MEMLFVDHRPMVSLQGNAKSAAGAPQMMGLLDYVGRAGVAAPRTSVYKRRNA